MCAQVQMPVEVDVSHLVWILGIKIQPSVRAIISVNC